VYKQRWQIELGHNMSIDQQELENRLKQAREACGLTQDESAGEMGMGRATIAQIKLGNRSVAGIELSKFGHLYARDLREFLAPAFSVEGLTAVLFPLGSGFRRHPERRTATLHCSWP